MNKKICMVVSLILLAFFLTGCWRYGTGKTYGYITTVEDGIIWNKVWIRAELESSQTDCYVFKESDGVLEEQLREHSYNGDRVEVTYRRHIWVIASSCNDDEVVSARKIG